MKFETFGDFLVAVRMAGEPAGRVDSRLEHRGVAAGGSEAVPSDGGFLVSPEHSRNLVERLYLTNAVLSRCAEFPISKPSANGITFPQLSESSRKDGSRLGGVRAYWQNEADTATATKPKFQRSQLTLKKLIALAYLTDELVMDAGALEMWSLKVFPSEIGFKLEDAILNGDGSGKLQGILSSPALIQVPKQAGQAAGSITAQNIVDVFSRTWAPSRRTEAFLFFRNMR